jgi:hypothetical protein
MRQPLRLSLAALATPTAAATLLVGLLFVLPIAASAQPPMSKPATELQKLAYLAGKWEGDSATKPGGPMPAGKVHTTQSCEWFPGGFFMVCRSKYTGGMGTIEDMSELGYDAASKTYTYHSINNLGEDETATGTVTGDTWTWSFEAQIGPRKVPARYVSTLTSPTSYTSKVQSRGDDGAWTTFLEGSLHKLGSR